MADVTDLVSVVHEVYKDRGGSYEEGTSPRLTQAAAQLYNENREFVRAASKAELRKQEQAIVQAIRQS